MEKELAAWLMSKKYASSPEQGIRFVRALEKGECTEEMADFLKKNLDIMMEIGGSVTAENLLPFLQEKIATAKKLIDFWKDNPKDTNAVFFHRVYSQIDWEQVSVDE